MMKHAIKVLVLALVCAVLPRAQAVPYSTYLNEVSNLVAFADAVVPQEMPRVRAIVKKALSDFQKPSKSIGDDFGIFIKVATHLTPLQRQPGAEELSGLLANSLSNAFTNFVIEAQTEILFASNRVAQLSSFQKQKRAASNQVAQAQRAMNTAFTTDNIQIGMLSVRLAYLKVALANKLAAAAEAKPGKAPNAVAGKVLTHTENGETGALTFTSETTYTSPEGDGTYEFDRTGLDTATLQLHSTELELSVKLKFTSSGAGTFTYTGTDSGGATHGSGTFTLE